MNWYNLIFYFFEGLAVVSALGLLFSRNVFYGALLIIACLLSLAALYVLAFAEFIAITQILIYAGGILVVIIFGIMLTNRSGTTPLKVEHSNIFSGLIISVPLLVILLFTVIPGDLATSDLNRPVNLSNSVENIGINLMTEHVLVFELSGVLLLIALIGAAVIASHKPKSA